MVARKRPRVFYAVACFVVFALGMLSRSDWMGPEGVLREYSGDTLWAALVYLLLATALVSLSKRKVAMGALLFSFAIEMSQLYHAPWIDAIRSTRIGALILGHGFLWSDLVCYSAGIGIALCIDAAIQRGIQLRDK